MGPWGLVGMQGGIIVVLTVVAWLVQWFTAMTVPFYWPEEPMDILIGVNFGLFLSIVFLVALRIDRGFGPKRDSQGGVLGALRTLFRDFNIFQIFLISLLAGVGEEYFFRGNCQTHIGLVASSIIFGLLHFLNTTYFFVATFAGLILGCLMEFYNNLAVPMIAHFVTDFAGLLYLVYFFDESPEPGPEEVPPAKGIPEGG